MNTNNTKHTPGPWWVDDNGCVAAGHGDTYETIAIMHDWQGDSEREANARLIAAAPELLEALRAVLDEIDENECGQSLSVRIGKARAAIAKATQP